MPPTPKTSTSELKTFTTARRVSALLFLVWAAGCAAMLWIQLSFLCPGTRLSFLFSDVLRLGPNAYLTGSGAFAMAASTYLVLTRAPNRNVRWSLFALALVVMAIAFTFRGVHAALVLGVGPTLWSLRFALMKDPQGADAKVAPSHP